MNTQLQLCMEVTGLPQPLQDNTYRQVRAPVPLLICWLKENAHTVNSVLVLQVKATCLSSLKLSQKGNNSNIRLVTML